MSNLTETHTVNITKDFKTLRDEFAIIAMKYLISGEAGVFSAEGLAAASYEYADAMLRARGE